MFPTLPPWDALHPLIIHFPVALLLVAPLFVLAALLRRSTALGFSLAALLLMVLGTIAVWVAVGTGEAAGELAERLPGVPAVLERHEELAELTRTIFTVLTLIFTIIVLAPLAMHRQVPRMANLALTGTFLLLYLGSTAVLANTAHQGGRLVHEFGVHALMPASPAGAPLTAPSPLEERDHDGDDD